MGTVRILVEAMSLGAGSRLTLSMGVPNGVLSQSAWERDPLTDPETGSAEAIKTGGLI